MIMTLEQLLSPAVLEWTKNHEHLPDDLLLKEDKAINLSKNIIKSVSSIEKFMKK